MKPERKYASGAALALACVPAAVAAANAIYARGKVTPEKLNTVVKRYLSDAKMRRTPSSVPHWL